MPKPVQGRKTTKIKSLSSRYSITARPHNNSLNNILFVLLFPLLPQQSYYYYFFLHYHFFITIRLSSKDRGVWSQAHRSRSPESPTGSLLNKDGHCNSPRLFESRRRLLSPTLSLGLSPSANSSLARSGPASFHRQRGLLPVNLLPASYFHLSILLNMVSFLLTNP